MDRFQLQLNQIKENINMPNVPDYYPGHVSAATYFMMNPEQTGWSLAQIWEGRNPDGTTTGPTGQPSGGTGDGTSGGSSPSGAGPGIGGSDPLNPPTPADEWIRPVPGEWPSDWPAIVKGVSPKLPQMVDFNRAELIKRARFGYSLYGYRSRQGQDLGNAWNEVDRMKAFTGEQAAVSRYAYNDFDFALYGTLIRLWNLTYSYGDSIQPRDYAGFTLERYFADEKSKWGGTPSGG